ncbi:MAG: S-layer homology domain-containing protein, partial [Rubrobacteridae bacterium]|nr:S-layer homology domain-containing protein [Rubrobacteridae bacterium]
GIKPDTGNPSGFRDTKGHWAAAYIESAVELGIVKGYVDGSFRPDNNVTRAEMAKMVVETKSMPVSESPSGFNDCSGYWADPFIAALKSTQIISGYSNNRFKPSEFATRAEACKIIWLMLTN